MRNSTVEANIPYQGRPTISLILSLMHVKSRRRCIYFWILSWRNKSESQKPSTLYLKVPQSLQDCLLFNLGQSQLRSKITYSQSPPLCITPILRIWSDDITPKTRSHHLFHWFLFQRETVSYPHLDISIWSHSRLSASFHLFSLLLVTFSSTHPYCCVRRSRTQD